MTVVYLDTLVFLNLWLDSFLLTASRRLAGLSPRWRRTLPAAMLGAVYAGASCVVRNPALTSVPIRLAVALCMVRLSVGEKQALGRVTAVFVLLSCTLAGTVLMVTVSGVGQLSGGFPSNWNDARLLMLCGAGEYWVVSSLSRYLRKGGKTVSVLLQYEEKTVLFRVLVDTGNLLKDPVTGQPVLIAEWDAVKVLFSESGGFCQDVFLHPLDFPEVLSGMGESSRLRLLPYRALGTEHSMLLGIRMDRVEVDGSPSPHRLVAVSGQKLSKNGTYQGIIYGL